jgi:hypothetical protein
MNLHLRHSLLVVALFGLLAGSAAAQTLSPFQPTYRPLGLPLVGKTYLAATDSTSATFQTYAAGYVSTIQQLLPEHVAFTGAGMNQLDPTRLYFWFNYAPRVYYIYEGACYLDALGVTIATVSAPTSTEVQGTNYLVFPLVQSSISPVCATGTGVRTATEPLMLGDFVQLPTVNAGQQLAFFLASDMASNSTPANVWYNGASNNTDGYQHLVAFFPDNNSQYIIIGFEDMAVPGADKDCNDSMFVVDIGPLNAAALRSASSLPK